MEWILELPQWFADPARWQGSLGIPTLLWQHVGYTVTSLAAALAIALPIGLWTGHTGRGGTIMINIANVGRAIPSLGILLLVVTLAGIGFLPAFIALVAFAIPPILTNTYTGLREVDPEVRDAAEGMGMRGHQLLWQVELPLAMPLIMAGIRTSAVQVVATATIAALVGLGGFGRYVINGLSVRDFAQVTAGALLAGALALVVEAALARLQRLLTLRGVRPATVEQTTSAKLSSRAA